MSSVHFFSPAVVAEKLDKAFMPQAYYIELSCIALIVYEYLLTVASERRVVWGRKFTIPTALFYANRYSLLLFGLSIFLWGFVVWDSDDICRVPDIMQFAFAIILELMNAVFTALRIHSINNRRWFWTILVLLLACAPLPPNFILVFEDVTLAVSPPFSGCAQSVYESDRLDNPVWTRVAVAVQACGYLGSIIVVCITWYRTIGIAITARKAKIRTSLVSLLLRDGTTYFLLSLIVDSVVIYLEVTRSVSLGMVAISLQSILMTRFILNLRMLDRSEMVTTVGSQLRFAPSAFDNLGASLDVDGENDYEDTGSDLEDDDACILGETHASGTLGEYHVVPRTDDIDV